MGGIRKKLGEVTEGDSKRGEGGRSRKGQKMQRDGEGEEDVKWKERELSKARNRWAVRVWVRLKLMVWWAQ